MLSVNGFFFLQSYLQYLHYFVEKDVQTKGREENRKGKQVKVWGAKCWCSSTFKITVLHANNSHVNYGRNWCTVHTGAWVNEWVQNVEPVLHKLFIWIRALDRIIMWALWATHEWKIIMYLNTHIHKQAKVNIESDW